MSNGADGVAMGRRVEAARARIVLQELGPVGRGGGSLGHFTEELHPRTRGKFAHSYSADAKKLEKAAEVSRARNAVRATERERYAPAHDAHRLGREHAAGAEGKWKPGQYGDVKDMPVGARYHTHQGDNGHGLRIVKKHKDGSATTEDAAGNRQKQHKSSVGYYAAHPGK